MVQVLSLSYPTSCLLDIWVNELNIPEQPWATKLIQNDLAVLMCQVGESIKKVIPDHLTTVLFSPVANKMPLESP